MTYTQPDLAQQDPYPWGGAGITGAAQGATANAGIAQSQANAAAAPTSTIGDAQAQIQQLLDLYGLGALANWAYQQLVGGQSTDQIALSLTQTPEYKARFPAIELRQKAGLPPLSATDYVSYEDTVAQLERDAGFPPQFMANKDVTTQLLANDVSTSELSNRIQNGYVQVEAAPQAVRDAFNRFFGQSGNAALAMTFLDPKLSEAALMKQVGTAQAAGLASMAGFSLNQGQALNVSQLAPTEYRMRSGLQMLQGFSPLFSQTVGEQQTGAPLTAQTTGVNAVFNSNASAQFSLAQQAQERQQALSGSSQAVSTQTGEVGLGQATVG